MQAFDHQWCCECEQPCCCAVARHVMHCLCAACDTVLRVVATAAVQQSVQQSAVQTTRTLKVKTHSRAASWSQQCEQCESRSSAANVLKTLESQAWCYYCEGRRHRRVTAHVVKSRPPASSTATTAPALRLTARCQQIRALIDPFYYPGLLTAKCPAAAIGAPSVILGKPVRLAEKNCAP